MTLAKTRISVFLFLILFFLAYFFYEARNFIFGPDITVSNPLDGAVLRNSHVLLRGQAKNISFLSLDGRRIFTQENGSFTEDLLLFRGYNTIELSAQDKFGRKIVKRITVMVKDE